MSEPIVIAVERLPNPQAPYMQNVVACLLLAGNTNRHAPGGFNAKPICHHNRWDEQDFNAEFDRQLAAFSLSARIEGEAE